ncbi:MAG: Crp/Fnr family transcriptional regulator [Hyphomicrobiales bacterium]|nr:MAG: Crp/Fnr family transcriptional regulator [Hyphomicrobiales bacterium]
MTCLSDVMSNQLAETLGRIGRKINAPAGTQLFRPGSGCDIFIVVLTGQVRVQMVSETGREIVLYRVNPGETCVLTTSCLLTNSDYQAEGIAETDIEAHVIDSSVFKQCLADSEPFRDFVFSTYSRRFADLIELIEEVVFRRIDIRLARHLMKLSDENGCVNQTHQELAVELGSAREVISRQLKEFERRGWVTLSRGKILLENCGQLRNITGEARG